MKKTFCILISAVMSAAILSACDARVATNGSSNSNGAELIADIPTVQYFTDEKIPDDITENILMAGINAPSAMNKQQWHFSVVTNKEILEQISGDMSKGRPDNAPPSKPDGMPKAPGKANGKPDNGGKPQMPPMTKKAGLTDAPLAIIISCAEGAEFDAGLSCQNMSAEANLLGYGTKILSSPTIALNGAKKAEYKELLNIPDEMSAVAVLLVGKEDTSVDTEADGYTSATERNPFRDTVTYVE